MLPRKNYYQKGFTLIEILTVISIIAVISVVAIVSLKSINSKNRDAQRIVDIKKILFGMERYKAVYGYYPNCFEGVGSVCSNKMSTGSWYTCLGEKLSPFIGEIPSDPNHWFEGYCYIIGPRSTGDAYYLSHILENDNPSVNNTLIKRYSALYSANYFVNNFIIQDYRQ